MRHYVRILITAFAAFSLVLAILLAAQSVRSLWKMDIVTRYTANSESETPRYRRVHAVSSDGRLSISFESASRPHFLMRGPLTGGARWEFFLNRSTYRGPGRIADPAFLGFTYLGPETFPGRGRDGTYVSRVGVPWWALTAAAGVLPILSLSRRWGQRRRASRAGLCFICGYDLRATPDHCPECGCVSAGNAKAAA